MASALGAEGGTLPLWAAGVGCWAGGAGPAHFARITPLDLSKPLAAATPPAPSPVLGWLCRPPAGPPGGLAGSEGSGGGRWAQCPSVPEHPARLFPTIWWPMSGAEDLLSASRGPPVTILS